LSCLHSSVVRRGLVEEFLELLDGPQVAHLGGRWADFQDSRGFGGGELLEMPHDENLAIFFGELVDSAADALAQLAADEAA
jgi:hypothetical protein